MERKEIIESVVNEILHKVVNEPVFRKMLIIELTEVELAELTLHLEGECDLTKKTNNRINNISRKFLNEIDPNFLIQLEKINNLKNQ